MSLPGQRLGWNFALTSPLSGALHIRLPAGVARAINCSRISGVISVNKSKGEVIPLCLEIGVPGDKLSADLWENT
jgi:hypothetical protein